MSRGGGMVDAMDSKSIDRKVMRVRLSPAAPRRSSLARQSFNFVHQIKNTHILRIFNFETSQLDKLK